MLFLLHNIILLIDCYRIGIKETRLRIENLPSADSNQHQIG